MVKMNYVMKAHANPISGFELRQRRSCDKWRGAILTDVSVRVFLMKGHFSWRDAWKWSDDGDNNASTTLPGCVQAYSTTFLLSEVPDWGDRFREDTVNQMTKAQYEKWFARFEKLKESRDYTHAEGGTSSRTAVQTAV